ALVVDLHADVAALGQEVAGPLGQVARRVAGGPAAQAALGPEADAHGHAVAGALVVAHDGAGVRRVHGRLLALLLLLLQRPALPLGVHEQQSVVDDARVARRLIDGYEVYIRS